MIVEALGLSQVIPIHWVAWKKVKKKFCFLSAQIKEIDLAVRLVTPELRICRVTIFFWL